MLTKGERIIVKRGPLAGMEITLHRRDNANRAWYGHIQPDEKILVYDYELSETVERKRKVVKRGGK
jgi:hypothetical protein